MNISERLQAVLNQQYGMEVSVDEIGSESIELYADEIDEMIVPSMYVKDIYDPIPVEMANYTDGNEDNYVLIQLQLSSILEVLLLNEKVVYQKLA